MREVAAGGGQLLREPMSDRVDEAPHLAMCVDPGGQRIHALPEKELNRFTLASRKRRLSALGFCGFRARQGL